MQTCEPNGVLHEEGVIGGYWLVFGWLGALGGLLGWFANLLWLLPCMRMLCRRRPNLILSALAVAALLTIRRAGTFNYLDSPVDYHLCRPQVGFWLWIIAISIPLVVNVASRFLPSESAIEVADDEQDRGG